MASTYALPLSSGTHAHSQHGHHTHSSSLPFPRSPSWPTQTNGDTVKKKPSNGDIKAPSPFPGYAYQPERSPYETEHQHHHAGSLGSKLSSIVPMKNRPRGESDLGRPHLKPSTNVANGYGFPPVPEEEVEPSRNGFSAKEALSAVLVPLPYLIASIAYPPTWTLPHPVAQPESTLERLIEAVADDEPSTYSTDVVDTSPLVQACALASGTLLLVGLIAKFQISERVLDRRKTNLGNAGTGKPQSTLLSPAALQGLLGRILSVGLPFYAAMLLGGARSGLVLLIAIAAGFSCGDVKGTSQASFERWKLTMGPRKWTCAALLLGMVLDFKSPFGPANSSAFYLGYLALALSLLVFPLPLPTTKWTPLASPTTAANPATSAVAATPWETPAVSPSGFSQSLLSRSASPLIASSQDVTLTLLAGALLSAITVAASITLSVAPSTSLSAMAFSSLSMASSIGLIFVSRPLSLRSRNKLGAAIGCALTGSALFLLPSDFIAFSSLHALVAGVSWAALWYDTTPSTAAVVDHQTQRGHSHAHGQHPLHGDYSMMTAYLVEHCTSGSILHSVLIEKDSRRIAYFALLNLAFMLVQFFYGFVTGSLGLLTDSIHMLFDCLGLAVGLAAAVMSKWPPNLRFPYGYGKVETLSGFANGIFLLLVSIEIIWDAFERLWEGHNLHRLNELLIVSVLGFIVNIVGLTAFGHAHHGHSHGHDHSHDHSHEGHDHIHSEKAAASHSHSHDNENMQGIFLHILADALGSVAVIISTLLTKYYGWSGWDPIASCVIAILIFFSALPLVKSSGMRLLLSLPEDVEYNVRNALQEISSLRGVVAYSVPRFWLEDAGAAHAETHAHSHDHKSGHGHDQDHCNHSHSHEDSHDHDHTHPHEHHEHSHDNGHDPHHDHSHEEHNHEGQRKVLGVIHVIASRLADPEDVRERAVQFLKGKGMDVVVHVEREGEGRCWCGGGVKIGG